MIVVDKLNKFYGSRHAVKDLSFAVARGALTGFLGGNGAGKSTTMRMLTGFLPPSSGTIKIDGIDLAENPLSALAKMGYLPESNPLYREMRVREFLDYRARLKDIPGDRRRTAIDRVIEICWLKEVENQIVGQLSKGFRQRVGLADCLLGDPPLLILDEPTVGLDPNQVKQTRSLIRSLGEERTVFLSTHLLHEVEMICDYVIIIDRGEMVAQGATRDLCSARDDDGKILRLRLSAKENPRDNLRALGLTPVEESVAGDSYFFRLQGAGDRRREIAEVCGRQNYLLEEMLFEPIRLEDIFSGLTSGGATKESIKN